MKITLRGENGKRDMADLLHNKWNKEIHCPNCSFHDPHCGAFNKDSGGNSDADGRRYRRFKCRSRLKCGKTLGVTEFIELCSKILPSSSLRNLPRLSPTCMYTILSLLHDCL